MNISLKNVAELESIVDFDDFLKKYELFDEEHINNGVTDLEIAKKLDSEQLTELIYKIAGGVVVFRGNNRFQKKHGAACTVNDWWSVSYPTSRYIYSGENKCDALFDALSDLLKYEDLRSCENCDNGKLVRECTVYCSKHFTDKENCDFRICGDYEYEGDIWNKKVLIKKSE